MSGYLQRIASGVLNPARAIHPMVGSMWAAREKVEAIETIVSEASTDAGPRRAAALRGETVHGQPARREETRGLEVERFETTSTTGDRAEMAEPAGISSESRTTPATPAVIQPLVAATQPDSVKHPIKLAGELKNQRSDATELAEVDAAEQFESAAHSAPAMFTPLVVSTSTNALEQTRALHSPPGAERRSPMQSLPALQAVQEPDEIQIHIGRIEVTAALPQPPARPAAKQRSSVNLAEYLKRDRRAR